MLFNSIQFLIFFVVVTFLYFILKHKYRWVLLLFASCIFYANFIPSYLFILFGIILIDYFSGIFIEKSSGHRKRLFLLMGVIPPVLVLFIFKYFNFFNTNFAELASFLNWNYSLESLSLLLPVGLSFYTFQSLSYIIEVYRGKQKAEKNIGIYALYLLFYPQLVAGPIERSQNLIHQFYEEHNLDIPRLISGLQIMLWGFFLKVVIADRSSMIVNSIYNNVHLYSGMPLIIATYLFAFQIFCDFAGYSLIAIGCARVMGFKLMDNFKRPYFAKSIPEFWNRWHISLSTWFRDYVYFPLGGNRTTKIKTLRNLVIVFLISGLWHGAAWTFVIWGALHAFYMVISVSTEKHRAKIAKKIGLNKIPTIHNLIRILITFNLVAFGWIFFRANSLSDAVYIITHLFSNLNLDFITNAAILGGRINFLIVLICILIMEIVHYMQEKTGIRPLFYRINPYLRAIIYILVMLIILLFGVFTSTKFIYFQF